MRLIISGKSFKLYNPGYTTIENEIFWNGVEGGWEKKSIQVWQRLCNCSNTILDIGANTGIYSFIANAVNPNAKIYAFEPVERTSQLLLKNIALNMPNNITFHQKAVSNKTGTATFYDVPSQSQYSASLKEEMLEQIENRISYQVEVIDLDKFEPLKNKKIDLIKLDVEMHEPQALEGMINIIHKSRPVLLIEILTEQLGKEITLFFVDLDYVYFNIDEKLGITPGAEISKSKTYNYLILPSEKLIEFQKLHS